MTREVVAVPAHLALEEVATRYFGPEQAFRGYPVVTAEGRVAGMLDRQVLQAARARYPAETRIADVLEPPEAFALPHETCRIVAARMAMQDLERIAVVGDPVERRLVGLISRSDLVKTSRRFFEEEHRRERLIRWVDRRA